MPSLKIALALILCSLAACESMIPPTPPDEQAGYKAAAPIIAALERFQQDHGHYPATLRELMPRYVRHVRETKMLGTWDETKPFDYRSEGGRYTLNFSFFKGVTIESRTYDSDDKKWHPLTVHP
jgi:hypothetical protein